MSGITYGNPATRKLRYQPVNVTKTQVAWRTGVFRDTMKQVHEMTLESFQRRLYFGKLQACNGQYYGRI